MKKISLLPRAEKIPADRVHDNETIKVKGFGIKVNIWVLIALFLITIGSMCVMPSLLIIMFGALFILMSFNKSGSFEKSERIARNTMWNRLPFLFIGIFLEILGIAVIIIGKKGREQGGRVFRILILLFCVALVLLMIGRLVFLISCIRAVSKRKEECTDRVFAEPGGFAGEADIMEGNVDLSDPNIGFVYRYYYQGEYYRFIIYEGRDALILDDGKLEVYIDPDQPDRYYSDQFFRYKEDLKSNIAAFTFLLVAIIFLLILVNIRNIMDFFIEKY